MNSTLTSLSILARTLLIDRYLPSRTHRWLILALKSLVDLLDQHLESLFDVVARFSTDLHEPHPVFFG